MYHWALVTIIATKTDIDAKAALMNGVKRHCKNLTTIINEAIIRRRKLVLNPYVDTATNSEIYDQFMTFAEAGQRYLRSIQDDIRALRQSRRDQHEQLDSIHQTSNAASNSTYQQTDPPTGSP